MTESQCLEAFQLKQEHEKITNYMNSLMMEVNGLGARYKDTSTLIKNKQQLEQRNSYNSAIEDINSSVIELIKSFYAINVNNYHKLLNLI